MNNSLDWLKFLMISWLFWGGNLPVAAQETTPDASENNLDIPPEIIEDSPALQRWLEKIPNVWEDIHHIPSFRTRFSLGLTLFPSTDNTAGINVGIEDIFIGKTGLTLSGDYQTAFNGDRTAVGTNLHYFLFPLGSYVNVAPLVGYRYIKTNDYDTDGVNVGVRLMLALSRSGAADISLSQSFISPGSNEEVGITNLAVGYALTPQLRFATEIERQNSRQDHDNRVGINLEWMF